MKHFDLHIACHGSHVEARINGQYLGRFNDATEVLPHIEHHAIASNDCTSPACIKARDEKARLTYEPAPTTEDDR